jgi:hypothetical protein
VWHIGFCQSPIESQAAEAKLRTMCDTIVHCELDDQGTFCRPWHRSGHGASDHVFLGNFAKVVLYPITVRDKTFTSSIELISQR